MAKTLIERVIARRKARLVNRAVRKVEEKMFGELSPATGKLSQEEFIKTVEKIARRNNITIEVDGNIIKVL